MIEVKCNGRIYLFSENSEILDTLDMRAVDVMDDPGDTSILAKPSSNKIIYTRNVAAKILRESIELLRQKNVVIEFDTDKPDKPASPGKTRIQIHGTEYATLLDKIEEHIISAVNDTDQNTRIIRGILYRPL